MIIIIKRGSVLLCISKKIRKPTKDRFKFLSFFVMQLKGKKTIFFYSSNLRKTNSDP